MDLFGLIRRFRGLPRPGEPGPWESSCTLFLKLVSRHRAGSLVLSHYMTNPIERPDHVFQHDSRLLTFTQGDFETTRLTVTAITPEEDEMLERRPGNSSSERLVVLTDGSGNVILMDYHTADAAERAMTIVEQSARGAS